MSELTVVGKKSWNSSMIPSAVSARAASASSGEFGVGGGGGSQVGGGRGGSRFARGEQRLVQFQFDLRRCSEFLGDGEFSSGCGCGCCSGCCFRFGVVDLALAVGVGIDDRFGRISAAGGGVAGGGFVAAVVGNISFVVRRARGHNTNECDGGQRRPCSRRPGAPSGRSDCSVRHVRHLSAAGIASSPAPVHRNEL